MPKKPYYKVDNEKMIVSFVVEKLTENEVKAVKNYIAFGYKPNAVKTEQLFPKKESLYTKDNIYKFLNSKGEEEVLAFEKWVNEKNDNGRKKGFISALKWFRSKYEKEFLNYFK